MLQEDQGAVKNPASTRRLRPDSDRILVQQCSLSVLLDLAETEEEEAYVRKVVDTISSSGFDVPVIPEVAAKAIQILRDMDYSIVELNKLILKDPVLTAKILRVANSAMYGGRMEVSTVRQAIVRIGYRTITNIILATSFVSQIAKRDIFGSQGIELWKHSVGCAYASRHLAKLVELNVEDAFLVGLLHDIGKVGLLTVFYFLKNQATGESTVPTALHHRILEQATPAIGGLMARGWRFPVQFEEAIAYRNSFERAPNGGRMAAVLNLADKLCSHFGIGETARPMDLMDDDAARALGLEEEDMTALLAVMPQIFAASKDLL